MVKIFAESGVAVCWHLRNEAAVEHIKETGHNPNYLDYLQLPAGNIHPTSDLEEAAGFCDTVLFVIPSAYLIAGIASLDGQMMKDKRFLVSIKGVVGEQNRLPSDYLEQRFGTPVTGQAVIAGPCHAEEIATERKTYITIASKNKAFAEEIAGSMIPHYIKTIVNTDPVGVEYAAILKNVIGIACGIAKGLNYGDNFMAVIVSNAMREIKRFLYAVDPVERHLSDSAYFGDLLVTAYSPFSRNRTLGQMVGRGYSVQQAQLEMTMVAEGYYAVEGIYHLARHLQVDVPIVSTVYRILYNRISPYVEFKLLENKLI